MGSRNTSSQHHAKPRRQRRVIRAVEAALRPQMESVESRVLFSAYQLSEFGQFGVNATGAYPTSPLVADASGNLYGTTYGGGTWGAGTVFEMTAGSHSITALASFNGTNGAEPSGVTLDSSGNLFGTTPGGTTGYGTIFEVARGSHAITTLVAFNGSNGSFPEAGLTQDSAGNLYGATALGVFEIAWGSSNLTQIASLSSAGGGIASGVAIDGSGNLYGLEGPTGGAYGGVFEIAQGSGAATTIASFNNSTGYSPIGGVAVDTAGNVYGATSQGGANGYGTVYEIAGGSSAITTIVAFAGTGGQSPVGPVSLDGSGNLYGAIAARGGTVFEIPGGSNTITNLAAFGTLGAPSGVLLVDSAGNIFGTNRSGAAGEVFEIPKGSSVPAILAAFAGTNGSSLGSGVTLDSSGNLFGATDLGGASGNGTVFEIAAGSAGVTTLASFNGTNGSGPAGPLILDPSSNLYGVTASGGSYGGGTVFEIAHGSTVITTLVTFNQTSGEYPTGGLISDASGNLYGITTSYGPNGKGAVFEISGSSHTLTMLAGFNSSVTLYSSSNVTLTLDPVGNLYGSTSGGGTNGDGTVFELAKGSNQIATLASFNGTDGKFPIGGVVRDAAGKLYGATESGGPNNSGVLFELPSGSNTLTILAAFDARSIGYGSSRLSMDVAGNLYGTTSAGNNINGSNVFELPKGSSTLTSLMTIASSAILDGGVTLDAYGNLYGTNGNGGPGSAGTVFKLIANTAVTLSPAGASNPSGTNQASTFNAIVTGGVPDGEAVSLVDASNGNAVVATGTLAGGAATLTIPAWTLTPGTHNLVAVYVGDPNYAASESAAYAQSIQVTAPVVVGAPVVNGDNPNGLYTAAGQTTPGQQRSMVEDIVYTFNEPVTISNANLAFTLAVAGTAGGSLPSTLYSQAVAGSNGTQWAVSLTGQPVGTLASIANGEYSITINPAYVFAAADGVTSMAPGTGRTDSFYRLYGDVFGTQNVTALDYSRFKGSLTTYNPMFDNYNTGNITALDYAFFKKDLSIDYSGDGFVTTI